MPSLQKSGGLKFNGTSDYVDIGLLPSLNLGQAGSFETWVTFNVMPPNQPLIIGNWANPWTFRFGISSPNIGQFCLNIRNNTGQDMVMVTCNITPNQLIHVVGTYDTVSKMAYLYLNGIQVSSQNLVNANLTPMIPTNHWLIGKKQDDGSLFSGKLNATRIYNRALSPTEVQMNYQGQVVRDASLVGEWLLNATSGTVATDTSGNGNHGTLNGGTWGNKAVKQKPKKNLWNEQGQAILRGAVTSVNYNSTTKEYAVVMGATSQSDWGLSTCYGDTFNPIKKIDAKQGNVLGISATITGIGFYGIFVMERDINGTTVNSVLYTSTTAVHTVANVNTVVLEIIFNGNANQSFTVKNIQVEKNVVTAFEPYQLIPDLVARVNPLQLAPQGKIAPYRGTDFTFARPSVESYNGMTVPMDTPRIDKNGVMIGDTSTGISTPESLTFPTANVLNASAGTIEIWTYEDGITTAFSKFFFDTDDISTRINFLKNNANQYTIATNNVNRIITTPPFVGFHLMVLRWNGTSLDFFIDGMKQSAVTIPSLVYNGTMLFLGTRYTKDFQRNNSIKSLRISNVARSDQEILDIFNKSQAYMHLPFDDSTTKLLNF